MRPATILTAAIALGISATLPAAGEEIKWWYETANPEQRRALDEILVQPFEAANRKPKLSSIIAAVNWTSSCASPCFPAAVRMWS